MLYRDQTTEYSVIDFDNFEESEEFQRNELCSLLHNGDSSIFDRSANEIEEMLPATNDHSTSTWEYQSSLQAE